MNFLDGRTPREKALVYLALALIALLLIWALLWRPVQNYYAGAQQKEQSAVRNLQIVTSGLGQIAPGPSASGGQAFNRSAVIETARSAGLAISRVQPENDGALKVWFNETNSEALFQFLKRFTGQYDADIASVQISRTGDGLINAQISFRAKNG